jgi:hypothetical protein
MVREHSKTSLKADFYTFVNVLLHSKTEIHPSHFLIFIKKFLFADKDAF